MRVVELLLNSSALHRTALLVACLALVAGCNTKPATSTSASAEAEGRAADAEAAAEIKAEEQAAKEDAPAAEPETKSEEPAATPEAKTDAPVASASNKVKLGSPELTAGIPGKGDLTVEEIKAWLDKPENHVPLEIELPLGLDKGAIQVKGIDKNPLTRAKIELGRQLYFDTRLSADNTVSCASCHSSDEGWARHTQFGVGIRGQQGGRNSPVSYNRILSDKQFWDGRAGSLEEQAVGPIQNPIEMGNTHEAAVKAIAANEGYKLEFDKIFGELTIETVGQALASFERSVVTSPTPYDYNELLRDFAGQDLDALKQDEPDTYALYEKAKADAEAHPMSDSAKRGRDLYFSEKASCSACHVGANLTDELYYNLGIGMAAAEPDLGRFVVTKEEKDKGAFKTPTIRNVALTAPYMHDGSQKTLAEVVEWYDKGGHPNQWLSQRIKPLKLTADEKKDLVAFLEACTGDFPPIETGRLPK